MWRPVISADGTLGWTRSEATVAPDPVNIKGPAGYTPVKGIDYHDGADGIGIPPGGVAGDVLLKQSVYDYDTKWGNINELIKNAIAEGLPEGVVTWDTLEGRPQVYDELGDSHTDLVTQAAVTNSINEITDNIIQLLEIVDTDVPLSEINQILRDHISNTANPHNLTPAIIGAASAEDFINHVNSKTNPHSVTKTQIGLSNVDNTSDMDKPISSKTQIALDDLADKINAIDKSLTDENLVTDVTWDPSNTTLTFIFRDDSELIVSLPIASIFENIWFDTATNELVITLPDGTENRINIASLIKLYAGSESSNIKVTTDNNKIIAEIIPDSVTGEDLIDSITLRGNPNTTTQNPTDRSTRLATTEFVKSTVIDNLISYETDRPLSANMGRILNETKADIDDVIEVIQNIEGVEVVDNLNSANSYAALSANMGRLLNLTKAPRVHTSPSGSTYGRATADLFGHVRAGSCIPLMSGKAWRGTDDGYYARADHRHPTDISRAPINFPDVEHNQYRFTGEPRAVSPPADSNDDRIATTEWVLQNARFSVDYLFAECKTSKSQAKKEATIVTLQNKPFALYKGLEINVKFRNSDMSGDAITTLNVNGTGDYPVLYAGYYVKNGWIGSNSVHTLVFENNFWWLINPIVFAVKPEDMTDGPTIPEIWPGEDGRYNITFDPQGGHFTYIPDQIYNVTFDPQGGQFTYVPKQIYEITFDPQGGRFTYIPKQTYDITFDPDGGTFTYVPSQIYDVTFDPQGGTFTYIPTQRFNITFDPQGGTFTYVPGKRCSITFDPQGGTFTYIPPQAYDVTFDEQGGKFIGYYFMKS